MADSRAMVALFLEPGRRPPVFLPFGTSLVHIERLVTADARIISPPIMLAAAGPLAARAWARSPGRAGGHGGASRKTGPIRGQRGANRRRQRDDCGAFHGRFARLPAALPPRRFQYCTEGF